MIDLDERLRQGLRDLAPQVRTEGVFEELSARRDRTARRSPLRWWAGAALVLLVVGVTGVVAALVRSGGDGEVVSAGPGAETPRFVTTWLPDGFQLRDVDERPVPWGEGTWVDYTFERGGDEPVIFGVNVYIGDDSRPVPGDDWAPDTTVRGHPAQVDRGGAAVSVLWHEEPDVVIAIQSANSDLVLEDLLRVAEGLERVSEDRWRSFTAGGTHQPVAVAEGRHRHLRWTRYRVPDRLFVRLEAGRDLATVSASSHALFPLTAEIDGRWHIFFVADHGVLAMRLTLRDDTVVEYAAEEIAGAGEPPARLYVAVLEDPPDWADREMMADDDYWLDFAVVLPDGTERLVVRGGR